VASYTADEFSVVSRHGLRFIPDSARHGTTAGGTTITLPDKATAYALEDTLSAIAHRYGKRSAEIVAMQLEYPWPVPSNRKTYSEP